MNTDGPKLFSRLLLISILLTGLLLPGCGTVSTAQIEREQRVKNSPQYNSDEVEFENPINAPIMAKGSTWKYIRKSFFSSRKDPEPTGDLPVVSIRKKDWVNIPKTELYFAWLGHSSILIAADGKTILVDPVLEERASPFTWVGPTRFHPTPVTVDGLPPIDVVLITHDHYDHLEEPTMKALADKAGLFVVPLGIGNLLEEWEIPTSKIVELDWWESHRMGTLQFTATPAVHYANRGLFDGNERLWCSWSIRGEYKSFFVSGDSGYFDGFRKIGKKLGPFNVTFLKIGAYDEMWRQIHMTPEEAVQQHQDLRGDVMVPLHWATFDLGLHPWYEPIERMIAAADQQEVNYVTPRIGQQFNLNLLLELKPWWRNVDKL